MLSEDEKILHKVKHDRHLKNKKDVRDIRNNEADFKESNDTFVACIDMQKVLTIPHSQVGVQYYKTKLKLFNFTIFDMYKLQGYCFIWNKTIAAKGTDEVSSCLYRFNQRKKREGFSQFSFYCDDCGGQNRNSIVFSALLYFANVLDVCITQILRSLSHAKLRR